jgi:hypothetical protein
MSSEQWLPGVTAVADQLKAEIDATAASFVTQGLALFGVSRLTEDDKDLIRIGHETGVAAVFLVLQEKGWLAPPLP